MTFRSRDGSWRVEVIRLVMRDGRESERFLIIRDGYFVAEAATVAELARYVDLADLEEALSRRLALHCR